MKHIFILSFLICVWTNTFGQTYQPVLYRVNFFQTYIPVPYCDAINTDSIKYIGDTLIQNENYTKLLTISEFSKDTISFLRQDTNHSKMWLLSRGMEYLIYDLTLQVNDSFKIEHLSPKPFYIKVIKVDTLNEKKHIHFDADFQICDAHGTEDFQFIEGVGSNGGIEYQIAPPFYVFEKKPRLISYLLCEEVDGIKIFENKLFGGRCEVRILKSKDNKTKENYFVFPNPFSDYIQISSDFYLDQFQLINAMGQIVYSGNDIIHHNFSYLSNGLYFFKNVSQRSQAVKLIKE